MYRRYCADINDNLLTTAKKKGMVIHMNIFKKISSIAMAAIVVFNLTACSAPQNSQEAQATGKIELEYWHINSETFAGPTVTEIIQAFNESQDEIHVTEKFVPNTYQGIMQDLQAEAAAGTSPDLVQIGWSYKEYFSNNFTFTPADELFENYAEDGKDTFVDDTYSEAIKALAINAQGEIVGFPYGLSVPVLYINTDILSEANVDINTLDTWEGVAQAAKTISESTDKYGLYIAEYAYTWELQQIIESNGGSYITDGLSSINSPEAIEAYQLYADAVLVDESALHTAVEEGKQAFIKGEVGIYMESVSYSTMITTTTEAEVEVIAAPSWDGQDQKFPCGGNFLAVTSTDDEKKEATAKLLEWILAEENMLAWDAATGYIPPITSAADSELLATNEVTKMAYDCLEYAVPWASFPGDHGLKAEQILITTRDEILGGDVSVEEALSAAQDEINALYE